MDLLLLLLPFFFLFLGSPFAEKMLNIKFEESKATGKKGNSKVLQLTQENLEELKSDSGCALIIDTSDISS